jgi:cellobiose-specific phosphotransferase system component IIA
MISRTLKTSLVILHGSLITAMLMAIFAGIYANLEATSQTGNATSAANQTSQSLGNLTAGNFSSAQASLAEAREAIYTDRNFGAFAALNEADTELFILLDRAGPDVGFQQKIAPVRENINEAQDAVINGDFAKALRDLNSASTEIVKITLQLPPGENEEG